MRASEGGNKRLSLVAGHLTLVNTRDSEYGIGLKSVYLSRVDERGAKRGRRGYLPPCWIYLRSLRISLNIFIGSE